MAESGYLIISDITGYTAFVSQSELEHAKDSLDSLLRLLVEYTRRPMLISRLEGDAVISYALDSSVKQGQTLVELIENTYIAFRKARDLMIVNTTCDCRACSNIPHLDLKFFVHHGTFSFQHLGNHQELLGNDVNLIHRLTKNSVTEKTGLRAYTLYTNTAVNALGLKNLEEGMTPHHETYEHIGEVQVFIQDMNAIWEREREAVRFEIRPEDTLIRQDAVFPLPPTLLWDYLTRPEYRAVIHGSEWQRLANQPQGSFGPGTIYECSHGTFVSRNTIIDWHPFESYTTYETSPIPRAFHYVTYTLEPTDGGTKVSYIFSKARGSFGLRQMSNLGARRVVSKRMQGSFKAFGQLIENEISAGRFVSEATGKVSNDGDDAAAVVNLSSDSP